MATPRRTSPGRANAEKERTSPRGVARREYKFGKRMAARQAAAAAKPKPKPSTPAPSSRPRPNRFEGAMQTGAAARERGYGYLGRR